MGLALKQSEIDITDREHDKGLYYVSYDAEQGLFSSKRNEAIYVLTVEEDGVETKVSIALGNSAEQSAAHRKEPRDASKEQPVDGAEKLVQVLFERLRDDLKPE